jgi:hypothetical protein
MACKLSQVPNSVAYDAHTGDQVTLVTKDHIGVVLIHKAEYAGNQLVPTGQALSQLQFTVAAQRNTLKLVFVFSASSTGRGELREDCGQGSSQFLRDVSGTDPFKAIAINGK